MVSTSSFLSPLSSLEKNSIIRPLPAAKPLAHVALELSHVGGRQRAEALLGSYPAPILPLLLLRAGRMLLRSSREDQRGEGLLPALQEPELLVVVLPGGLSLEEGRPAFEVLGLPFDLGGAGGDSLASSLSPRARARAREQELKLRQGDGRRPVDGASRPAQRPRRRGLVRREAPAEARRRCGAGDRTGLSHDRTG